MAGGSNEELLDRIHELTGFEFERFIAALWELQGWTTEVTKTIGDGGRDIVARRALPYNESIKIEAKGWRNDSVSEPLVRGYALLPGESLDQAVVVTSSTFTEPAERSASRHGVKLVDRSALVALVEKLGAEPLLTSNLPVDDWQAVRSEKHLQWSRHPSPDGEVVTTIQGIGVKRSDKLAAVGIHTVAQLLSADATTVQAETDIPERQIERWMNLAACHLQTERTDVIAGIGDKEVRQLASVGMHTLDQLRDVCAKELAGRTDMREQQLKRWVGDAVRRDIELTSAISGIGTERAMSLAKAGILTVDDLAATNGNEVSNVTGLDEAFLEECIEEAQQWSE